MTKERYVYCKRCRKPIMGPLVSLDEWRSLLDRKATKKLAESCAGTREYCLSCYIHHIKKDAACSAPQSVHCVQNKNGMCLYVLQCVAVVV